MNNFKTLLSSRRKALKMTQKDLAQKLNVSDKTVSKWETGASYPEITLLTTIAKVLEINVNELLGVEDLQEKKINNDEQDYDYDIITKYRNKTFLAISLIFIGFALLLASQAILINDIQVIMIVLGLALYTFSIIFFLGNNIDFRNYYKRKFYTRQYDSVFVMYSSITIIIFALPFIFNIFLISQKDISIDTIGGIIGIASILIVILAYIAIINVLKISNYKIIKDLTNTILGIASIILIIIAILGILPIFLLPIVYFIGFIIPFRNKYIGN